LLLLLLLLLPLDRVLVWSRLRRWLPLHPSPRSRACRSPVIELPCCGAVYQLAGRYRRIQSRPGPPRWCVSEPVRRRFGWGRRPSEPGDPHGCWWCRPYPSRAHS